MAILDSPQQIEQNTTVTDRYGRRFRYVRISVTDLCNLSCIYCNPVQGCASSHSHKLSWDDLDFLVDVSVNDLGAEAVRITGGEPTVRPGLAEWVQGIRRFGSLRDVAMTTNGILLKRLGPELCNAGIDRVNISVDTFDRNRFREITRGGSLQRCLEGIDAAIETFSRVKLNCVAVRSIVLEELDHFVRFSDEKKIEVRFIELMPVFDAKQYFHANFIGVEELKTRLASLGYDLKPEGSGPAAGNRTGYGPATTYRVSGTAARLGFISQMSDTKCLYCNKLRLTSDGALKPCLLMPEEIDLQPAIKSRDRDVVARHMRWQFLSRAERYDARTALEEPAGRPMQATGG